MNAPAGPWQPEISGAPISALNDIWTKWSSPNGVNTAVNFFGDMYNQDVGASQIPALLGAALKARQLELENKPDQPGPNPSRKESTAERIDKAIIEHFAATEAYATAVEDSAKRDAEAKRLSARKYLEVKANVPEGVKRVTDTEANRAVDADEDVVEVRLNSDISAALAKAAKARLDHWEHVIEWGRSVYSRETRADTR